MTSLHMLSPFFSTITVGINALVYEFGGTVDIQFIAGYNGELVGVGKRGGCKK